MASQPAPKTIAGLDLVRFAAAMIVMWYHLAWWSWNKPASPIAGRAAFPELSPSADWTGIGVEIFFVLSGYVIALTAHNRTAGQFAWSRFLRLMPAAWICATISFAALLIYPEGRGILSIGAAYARAITLWPFPNWIDGVYWTLTVEVSFYLTVLVLIAIGRFDRFAWLLTAIALPGTAVMVTWALGADIAWFYKSHVLALLLVRHGFLFALGGFIWLAFEGKLTRIGYVALAVCAWAGAASILASPNMAPILATATWCLAVLAMLVSIQWNAAICRPLGRWLRHIRLIGLTTYPFYLVHNVVGVAVMRALLDAGAERYTALAGAILSVLALAFVIAAFLEPTVKAIVVAGANASARHGAARPRSARRAA